MRRASLLTLCVLASAAAHAQDPSPDTAQDTTQDSARDATPDAAPARTPAPTTTITINPVRFALLHFQIELDHALSDDVSLFVAPIVFHHATWYPFNKVEGATATGGGVDFGARFVLLGGAPAGLYVGPLVSAYYGVEHRDGEDLGGAIVSLGAQGGGNLILWDFLALGAGVGASYGFPTTRASHDAPVGAGLPHAGLWVNFRTNVGIAF